MRKQLFGCAATVILLLALVVGGCKSMGAERGEGLMGARAHYAPAAGAPAPAEAPEAKMMWNVAEAPPATLDEAAPGAPPPPPSPAGATDKPAQAIQPKIIRTGSAILRSSDLDADIKKVEDKVKTLNGYVAASTQDVSNELNKTANLTIKIPAEHFDGFMAFLKTAFKKEQIGTSSEDVGEEYVDVESRLYNKRLEEKRLIELLNDRTGKLSDVLEVERELARVREEIERMTGRLRYLDNRVGYSTITVTLIQSKQIESVEQSWSARFWHDVKQTFLDAISILGNTLRGLFILVVGGLPFWAIAAIIVWLVVRHRRKKRLAAQAAPPPPAPPLQQG